ncbi:dihydroneopterin aldolase [Paramicrobacterium humi]|uniref:7,8-dihydroneopterin aldolase n=1 Tax=Paramicrobacterium humi TaxID=640635 RepID=A0A1H4MQC0_9MICO|nr:dihydroneopterin aldolase [Microbacterium humi]SEB84974.1 dihydroneopterin aldolase [Microbacterium humi]
MNTDDLDTIRLTGIRVHAHHGVFAHEREAGQPFVADVTVWTDLRRAAASDDLTDTVHYGELAEQVAAALASDAADLIETVAERVAAAALGFAAVARARVTVHKPEAPITVPFDDVAVTITRERGEA